MIIRSLFHISKNEGCGNKSFCLGVRHWLFQVCGMGDGVVGVRCVGWVMVFLVSGVWDG